ncbi:MAG TPA: phosphopantetheine-binding protein [Planosporangium sp.]|jgi:acyl carrier protein|nr:phosphopantetheine-binding protein [Planosporangium sp.]
MDARELVAQCLDNPRLIDRIGDDEDLQGAGVNSGEVIQIALRCEEVLGRPLSNEEVDAIDSLRRVDKLLRNAGI